MMSTAPSVYPLSTSQVAKAAGVHRDTLLRWLRAGLIPEPERDRNGWRYFDAVATAGVLEFARSESRTEALANRSDPLGSGINRLQSIDWDFSDAKTDYLTHGLHPYPAKYIPQIPNALIQELSVTGETVADIFCGSGTTQVEALMLKRNAIGIDANPLACLITRAKTTPLSDAQLAELACLASRADMLAVSIGFTGIDTLFGTSAFRSVGPRPEGEDLTFWFDPHVIEELAEIKLWISALTDSSVADVARVCMSSIIVSSSKQDSDTRYVRREKGTRPGDTLRRFARALHTAVQKISEFTDLYEPRFQSLVLSASLLDCPAIPPIDLVVCSPPYPNAYSYHLYHRTRMLWLDMDQPKFKRAEIGSHRKYSSKGRNAATVDTFKQEMRAIFAWLRGHLRRDRYACFVVGSSTIGGALVDNAQLLSDVAGEVGFKRAACIARTMQVTKKAFNPAIGKIKTESVLILQNRAGERQ
ncbi:MAG TPA: DNA methyltransferase [Acidobacteriaceae bacterium]|nr:DNA methyltransferase [Acidobacteriaceae bacterium]